MIAAKMFFSQLTIENKIYFIGLKRMMKFNEMSCVLNCIKRKVITTVHFTWNRAFLLRFFDLMIFFIYSILELLVAKFTIRLTLAFIVSFVNNSLMLIDKLLWAGMAFPNIVVFL